MVERFDVKDYVEVAERIRDFYETYPEGSIQTEMVRLEGDLVVFKAAVYRGPEAVHPTTGWAYEREGEGYVNKTSFIENCETSAIGRALANLNFPTSRAVRNRVEQSTPAAGEQLERIRSLAEADAVSDEIRTRVLQRVDDGLTARQAADAVAYLERLHRKAERAA